MHCVRDACVRRVVAIIPRPRAGGAGARHAAWVWHAWRLAHARFLKEPACADSVKLRLSLAFGKRYSRALRGSPAVVKEAEAVPWPSQVPWAPVSIGG